MVTRLDLYVKSPETGVLQFDFLREMIRTTIAPAKDKPATRSKVSRPSGQSKDARMHASPLTMRASAKTRERMSFMEFNFQSLVFCRS